GWPRAFRGRRPRRPHYPSRAPLWRHRPHRRAAALGGGGAADADGTGAGAASGETEARRRQPHAPARGARTETAFGETAASAAGLSALPINLIRSLLERCREPCKGSVEHRAHQQRQHAALEFVSQEEADVAFGFGLRLKGPAVFKAGER